MPTIGPKATQPGDITLTNTTQSGDITLTTEQKKERKNQLRRLRNLTRIHIQAAFPLWTQVREDLNVGTDEEFAQFLLDSYMKCTCRGHAVQVIKDLSNNFINTSNISQDTDVSSSNTNVLSTIDNVLDVDVDVRECDINVDVKTEPLIDSSIQFNVDCDDKKSNIGLSLNGANRVKEIKYGDETESDVETEVVMQPSIVPKRKKNTQSYGEDYFKKKIFVPNTEEQQEDNESSTRRSSRLRGKRGTFKLKWNISDQLSDLSHSENEEKSWDKRQKLQSEDEDWMYEDNEQIIEEFVENLNTGTSTAEIQGSMKTDQRTKSTKSTKSRGKGNTKNIKTKRVKGPRKTNRNKNCLQPPSLYPEIVKQPNGLISSLPLPSSYPNIDVKLADHKDKYEISSRVSICAKDRGLNIEEKTTELLTCKLCEGKFSINSEDLMEKHIKEHLEGRLTCEDCQQVFYSRNRLAFHRLDEHVKKDLICEICAREFHFAKTLRIHLGKEHSQKTLKCRECKKMFSSIKLRRQHFIQDHPEHCTICEECGKMLTHRPTDVAFIEMHKKSVMCKQAWENGVKCPICDKQMNSRAIYSHIRSVHKKIQHYKCTSCPFTSNSGSKLRRHQFTHTGEHRQRCEHCSFTCIQPGQLTSHMRTHTGDKPYKCESCDYAAAWNVQLKDHRKAHDSPKQVTCEECNIVYKDRRGLNYHLRKVHSDASIPHSESKKTNARSPKVSKGDDNSSGTITLNSTCIGKDNSSGTITLNTCADTEGGTGPP